MSNDVDDSIAAWWAGVPSQHRGTFERLDALIRDVAATVDADPVEVTATPRCSRTASRV